MHMTIEPVTLENVYDAQKKISEYLPKTPLFRSLSLSKQRGGNAYIKCENILPTGASKV
jgi:threonine dehydratase